MGNVQEYKNGEWVEAKPIEFYVGFVGKIIQFIKKKLVC